MPIYFMYVNCCQLKLNTNCFKGQEVRIWVKATDVMGNSHADSTFVKVDKTPPSVSVDYDTALERNIKDGPYNYSSK